MRKLTLSLVFLFFLLSPLTALAYSEGYLISCAPSFSSPGCAWKGCSIHYYNWTTGKYGLQLVQTNEPTCAHCDRGIYALLNLEWIGPGRDLDGESAGSCDTSPLAAHCRNLQTCSWCQWAKGQYCPPSDPPCHPLGSEGGPFEGPLDGFSSGDSSDTKHQRGPRFNGLQHPTVFLIDNRMLLEEYPVTGHLHLISAPNGSLRISKEEAERVLSRVHTEFSLREERVRPLPNREFFAGWYWTLYRGSRPALWGDLLEATEASGVSARQVMPRVVE